MSQLCQRCGSAAYRLRGGSDLSLRGRLYVVSDQPIRVAFISAQVTRIGEVYRVVELQHTFHRALLPFEQKSRWRSAMSRDVNVAGEKDYAVVVAFTMFGTPDMAIHADKPCRHAARFDTNIQSVAKPFPIRVPSRMKYAQTWLQGRNELFMQDVRRPLQVISRGFQEPCRPSAGQLAGDPPPDDCYQQQGVGRLDAIEEVNQPSRQGIEKRISHLQRSLPRRAAHLRLPAQSRPGSPIWLFPVCLHPLDNGSKVQSPRHADARPTPAQAPPPDSLLPTRTGRPPRRLPTCHSEPLPAPAARNLHFLQPVASPPPIWPFPFQPHPLENGLEETFPHCDDASPTPARPPCH